MRFKGGYFFFTRVTYKVQYPSHRTGLFKKSNSALDLECASSVGGKSDYIKPIYKFAFPTSHVSFRNLILDLN